MYSYIVTLAITERKKREEIVDSLKDLLDVRRQLWG